MDIYSDERVVLTLDAGGTFSLPGVINFHTDAGGAVADNGDHSVVFIARIPRGGEAHRRTDGRAGMPDAKHVVFRFALFGKARNAPFAAQCAEFP